MSRKYVNRKHETSKFRALGLPLFTLTVIVWFPSIFRNIGKACQCDTMSEKQKKQKNDAITSNSAAVIRILDAAINRASEGLRVVEDFTRMILEDVFLSGQLKNLRHDLIDSCRSIDTKLRLTARDSEADVGRDVQVDSEYQREDLESIIRANMARVQQSTRTIEEYSKSHFPEITKGVEQIRYRAYTAEKAVFNSAFNKQRFADTHLYVLLDACGETEGFEKLKSLVSSLVAAKVDLIQLRDKRLTDRELIAAGKSISDLTSDSKTMFVVNDRADLCVAAEADGVHLGQSDLSVHEARMLLRPSQFVGVSTHSIEQAKQAVLDGADYIGVGPVFQSQTKSFDSHVGVQLVSAVCNEISLPAFAIGGIDTSNVAEVIGAGCRRVAVSSAVCNASAPAAAAEKLSATLRLG